MRKPTSLGFGTGKLFEAYRRVVPFLEEDRDLSCDIEKTYEFLKGYNTSKI